MYDTSSLHLTVLYKCKSIHHLCHKAKVEKADDTKSRLLIEKLEADEAKVEAKREMNDWMEKLNGCHSDFKESLRAVQVGSLSTLKHLQQK